MPVDGADELVFLPLGGAGEIGMNLNLYGYGPAEQRRWLMIDLGIGFGAAGLPGVDVVMADPSYIVERRHQLEGIVLTHAHEDHLGAVPYLWPLLRCPVYGSDFALAILRGKLARTSFGSEVPLKPIGPGQTIELGPFALSFISMAHSIPEAHAVIIRTGAGTLVHTGDWKLDPEPVVGGFADEAALQRAGDEGVLGLICDSTNVFEPGRAGSEGTLLAPLTELIGACANRVAVTCFSTNIARLHTIATAAHRSGREVVLAGSAIARNYLAAKECGYLGELPAFLDTDAAGYLPRNKIVLICTGSQGEPNAALACLAAGEHPSLALEAGDTVIFSSRVIPGNEIAIGRLQNQLLRRGIEVIGHRQARVHVSGHPARDELARMYALVRPRIAVPVHGELRHMIEHARLATAEGVPHTVVAENGTMVRFSPGPAVAAEEVQSGRLALEGNRVVPMEGELVRRRAKAVYEGAAFVTVALAATQQAAADVQLSTVGLLEQGEDETAAALTAAVRKAIDDLPGSTYKDDATVREAVRLAVRRTCRQILEKRPVTHVHLLRGGLARKGGKR
ncbi:MAG: ribonuclease J [Defluviicoccus sp.]